MELTLPIILFALIAGTTAATALGVVLARSLIHAAVWLLMTLIGVGLIYFLLGAEFLGSAHLIVYVGGTLVLVAFGVMLTSDGPFAGFSIGWKNWLLSGTLALALFALLVHVSLNVGERRVEETALPGAEPIGLGFLGFTNDPTREGYLLPFEIVSVHLLVVLIGAAYLARAKRRREVPTHE